MKKVGAFLKYTLLTIVSIGLILVLFVVVSNRIFIGGQEQAFTDYLKNNQEVISDKVEGKLFDNNFLNSQIFLFGEIHGYADNQKVDQQLFKFLNQRAGVRYYIAEIDSINSDKLNQYLMGDTKNQELLQEVVTAVKKRIPQQSSRELLEKWSDIYDYNQTLNDSLKVRVIGIDVDFDANSSAIPRDSAMYVNFSNSLRKLHIANEKFYGFFGFYHVLQHSPQMASKPLAAYLKNSGFKVSSIVSYTLDSEMYLPKNPQFPTPADQKVSWVNADGPLMLVKGINDFKELTKPNSMNLFKLDAEKSPFRTSDKLVSIKSRLFGENFTPQPNTSTVDYFQYLVLVKNSKALTPIP